VSEAVRNNMIQKFAGRRLLYLANPIDRFEQPGAAILHMIGKGMSSGRPRTSLNLSIRRWSRHRQRIKRS